MNDNTDRRPTDAVSTRGEADAVIIEPPETATATVIWLHGLGADGHDFESIVPELGSRITRATRFVFPHAPLQAVTINAGMIMRAWYDIRDMDLPERADEEGIRLSEGILRAYIETETKQGIPSERIVLAGFSQGGVIALRTGLTHDQRLAGILALSTYLPMQAQTEREAQAVNRSTPVFMAHGSEDPLIPMRAAQSSRDFLQALGLSVEWHSYRMPHSVCPEELRDLSAWLSTILS